MRQTSYPLGMVQFLPVKHGSCNRIEVTTHPLKLFRGCSPKLIFGLKVDYLALAQPAPCQIIFFNNFLAKMSQNLFGSFFFACFEIVEAKNLKDRSLTQYTGGWVFFS